MTETVSAEYTTVLKDISQEAAMDEFMRIVWWNMEGGLFDLFPKTGVVQEGEDEHKIKGAVRAVPFGRMAMNEEEILSCEYGEELVYTVRSGVPLFKYHRGTVTFEAHGEEDTDTLVTWAVEYEPNDYLSFVLPLVVRYVFTSGLAALSK